MTLLVVERAPSHAALRRFAGWLRSDLFVEIFAARGFLSLKFPSVNRSHATR